MEDATKVEDTNTEFLSKIQYYEQEFKKSISELVRNVSEYFQILNNTNITSEQVTTTSFNESHPHHQQSVTLNPYTTEVIKSFLAQTKNFSNALLQQQQAGKNEAEGSTTERVDTTFQDEGSDTLHEFIGVRWDEIATQLILLLAISSCLWLINRHVLKWSSLTVITEIVISWLLITLASPLALLFVVPILIARIGVWIYLKLQSRRQMYLANPFDSVWSFEQPHSPSTCVGFYIIEGDGELERMRKLLYTRVMLKEGPGGELIYDRFRWVLKTTFGFIVWERLDMFDIKNHVKHMGDRATSPNRKDSTQYWTESDVFEEIGNLHETSLCDLPLPVNSDNQKQRLSPWEILIVPKLLYKNGDPGKSYYGIIFRIHHSLMDGISMGHILHDCIADKPFKLSLDPTAPLKMSSLAIWIGKLVSVICFPRVLLRNLCFIEKNAFHGKTLIGPKKFTWSRPLEMSTLKQLKDLTKTSVFSVLLGCIGGSLKKLYEKKGVPVPKMIHACPPIAILPYPNRKPRNRFSVVLYPVLLGGNDRKGKRSVTMLERLEQVFKESKSLSSSPDVLANYYAVYFLGMLPYGILKLLAPLAHATFTFSNIPGPAETAKVLNGDTLVEIGVWVPVKNRIGIGAALFSYNDRLRVNFVADKAALSDEDDVEFLCSQFENEISELSLSLQLKCDKLFI